MRNLIALIFVSFLMSCVSDDSESILFINEHILSEFISDKTFFENEVIACSASDNEVPDLINVYFYPEMGSKDFRLYESFAEDGKDFSKYQLVNLNPEPLFQGAMQVFKIRTQGKWFVVTFELDSTIEISTPIRSKVFSQPTIWSDVVTINQEESLMPVFSWDINSVENNAIFFQVIATEDLQFLSGTYTQENKFQYYNLNNVVLNVTQGTPPNLLKGETYVFTLMDVSLDNWVNEVIMTPFVAE